MQIVVYCAVPRIEHRVRLRGRCQTRSHPSDLRTLAPFRSMYRGPYEGHRTVRDLGYTRETVWWLLGHFITAGRETPGTGKMAGAAI